MGATTVRARAEKAKRQPAAVFYVGEIVAIIDQRHARVSFGDKEVPAVVPASVWPEVGAQVRLRVRGNDYSIDSVITGGQQQNYLRREIGAGLKNRGWYSEEFVFEGNDVVSTEGGTWVALGPPGAGPIENRTRLGEVQDETMWYRLGPVAESNEGIVLANAAGAIGVIYGAPPLIETRDGLGIQATFPTIDSEGVWLGFTDSAPSLFTTPEECSTEWGFTGVYLDNAKSLVQGWVGGVYQGQREWPVEDGAWRVVVGRYALQVVVNNTEILSIDAPYDEGSIPPAVLPLIAAYGTVLHPGQSEVVARPKLSQLSSWIKLLGIRMDELTDVDVSGLVDGQFLVWDADSAVWVPKYLPGTAPAPAARAVTSGFSPSPASITATIPADTQVGDLLLLYLGCQDVATPPTGWRRLAHPVSAVSGSHGGWLFARTAQVGDAGSTVTVTVGSLGTPPWHVVAVSDPGPILSAGAERIGVAGTQAIYPAALGGGDGLMVLFGSARSGGPVDLSLFPALSNPGYAVQSTAGVQSRVAVGAVSGSGAACPEVVASGSTTGLAVAGVLIGGRS